MQKKAQVTKTVTTNVEASISKPELMKLLREHGQLIGLTIPQHVDLNVKLYVEIPYGGSWKRGDEIELEEDGREEDSVRLHVSWTETSKETSEF